MAEIVRATYIPTLHLVPGHMSTAVAAHSADNVRKPS
jgi:hypothetical protein